MTAYITHFSPSCQSFSLVSEFSSASYGVMWGYIIVHYLSHESLITGRRLSLLKSTADIYSHTAQRSKAIQYFAFATGATAINHLLSNNKAFKLTHSLLIKLNH